MFVKQSKYQDLVTKYNALNLLLARIIEEKNKDIDQINEKGGQEFLDKGVLFSDDELKTLIKLCHPDKHNGKLSATEITKKLNSLR